MCSASARRNSGAAKNSTDCWRFASFSVSGVTGFPWRKSLGDGERHRLLAIAALDPVIFPSERDGAVLERDQPAVGDGDAMGVAGEISEHRLGPAEGSLGIDDPCDRESSGEENEPCLSG